MTNHDWATRVAAVWDRGDEIGDNILLERIDALAALAPHLLRYQRSMSAYATELLEGTR
jgi:hypothetical protein